MKFSFGHSVGYIDGDGIVVAGDRVGRVYLSVWIRFPDRMLFPQWLFCRKFMVDVAALLNRLTVLR